MDSLLLSKRSVQTPEVKLALSQDRVTADDKHQTPEDDADRQKHRELRI
jgi:hypothetical protein